jgi:NSS family neurotransmitter:Na+ symporter
MTRQRHAGPPREHWGSGLGFVAAALGSAVGVGNVWRFSYVAGENGGAAFLLVYLVMVIVLGVPLMLAEFAIGRTAQRETVAAFGVLTAREPWRHIGGVALCVATAVLSYYAVIAGWTLRYFVDALWRLAVGVDAGSGGFDGFVAGSEPVLWQTVVLGATAVIVAAGVRAGIERVNAVLMPLLAVLLLGLAGYALTLPRATDGLAFVFAPDWGQLAHPQIYLAALGQVFFSLGLACGVMVTYGSYLSRQRAPAGLAAATVGGDTAFAIVAGVAIFPAVFSFGLDPAAGPALAFETMPAVFARMPGGAVMAVIFFGLLAAAALTSAVSLLEVPVAWLVERGTTSRPRATVLVALVVLVLGLPAALAQGPLSALRIAGRDLLGTMDFVASNLLMPINGVVLAVFVGWVWSRREAREASGLPPALGRAWHATIRWIAPLVITLVLLRALGLAGG